MNCKFHPEEKAVTKCAECGTDICSPCDTNAFFRVEKGALCLECSLKEAEYNVVFDKNRLKKHAIKLIFAAIAFILAIVCMIRGNSAKTAILFFVFWFLSGFIQTRGHEKHEGSLKSIMWEGHDEDDISLGKVIFYIFAAPVMLIVNLIKLFSFKKDLNLDISKYERVKAALEESYTKTFEFWKAEADKGDIDAQVFLANRYRKGEGVAQDTGKAIELLTKAAEQGNDCGQFNLGACYFYGEGVEKNCEKAVELFKKAAKQGLDVAQFNLGFAYYEGQGIEKDYAKAVEWWRKAAEQGFADAQRNLGLCYQEGKGVVQDHEKAVELWQMAAEHGDKKAQECLRQYT
ncbi:MAG: sel1 repeat family protein [Treponema sp.]|nr:sel1 repeat family protein [Treponema sp.]